MTDEPLFPELRFKRKKKTKYCYDYGDRYHVSKPKAIPIKTAGLNVPTHMGWLWNSPHIPGFKPKKGWTPGAIGKSVAKYMTFKCPRAGIGVRKKKKKKVKSKKTGDHVKAEVDTEEEELTPKPALRINRKGNLFTIEVFPLKDLTEIGPNEDPYVDCDPLVFVIEKTRNPEELARIEARNMVKMKKQRDADVRKALAEAVEDICKCAYMDVYCNDLSAIDKVISNCPKFQEPECICDEESMSSLSSQGTWDIEYTPPFGCFDLSPRKRKVCVHVETQYLPADFGEPEQPCKCKAKHTDATKKKCTSRCPKI